MNFNLGPFGLSIVAVASWTIFTNEIKASLQRSLILKWAGGFRCRLQHVVHNAPALHRVKALVKKRHALLEAVAIVQEHEFAMAMWLDEGNCKPILEGQNFHKKNSQNGAALPPPHH